MTVCALRAGERVVLKSGSSRTTEAAYETNGREAPASRTVSALVGALVEVANHQAAAMPSDAAIARRGEAFMIFDHSSRSRWRPRCRRDRTAGIELFTTFAASA